MLTKLTADVEALRKSNAVKSSEEQQTKADSTDDNATLSETIIPVQDPAIGTNDKNIDNTFSTVVEEMITSEINVEKTKRLEGKPKKNNSDDESSVDSV